MPLMPPVRSLRRMPWPRPGRVARAAAGGSTGTLIGALAALAAAGPVAAHGPVPTEPPTAGGSVCDVRTIVHTGAGGGVCQSTVTVAGALCPAALLAYTVYVWGPIAADVVVHVLVVLAQFVHVNDVGAFVHDAVSATASPRFALVVDARTVHFGAPTGGGAVLAGEHIATG